MRELLVFRQQVFRHLRQDWTDVIARARDLWSPKSRTRESYTGFESQVALGASGDSSFGTGTGSGSTSTGCKSMGAPSPFSSPPVASDGDDVPVVVEDQDRGEWIPSLWLPGRVLHLYSHAGRYKAVKVSRALPTLRKIEIQGNIFTDHASETIFDALLEVCCLSHSLSAGLAQLPFPLIHLPNSFNFFLSLLLHLQVRAVRSSDLCLSNSGGDNESDRAECAQGHSHSHGPPTWTPYDASALCACCQCPFTWHSTFQGEAQEYRERYNCRHCGGLVCGPCSLKRRAIPRLGLIQPSRVCDKCFHKVFKHMDMGTITCSRTF
jgi:FYVE zinc finger